MQMYVKTKYVATCNMLKFSKCTKNPTDASVTAIKSFVIYFNYQAKNGKFVAIHLLYERRTSNISK